MKLTLALHKKLIETAKTGVFLSTVADACGVSEEDLKETVAMGLVSGASGPEAEFAREFLATEAGLEIEVMKSLKLAMQVDPKIGLQYLALRFPRKYGPKATETGTVSELRPSRLDESQQAELMGRLLVNPPPRLVAILEEAGFRRGEEPKSLPAEPKPLKP